MLKRFAKVYEEGDSVYVIGFSRGAASARLFSNKILTEGVGGGTIVPEIQFLGCFDTVLEDQLIDLNQLSRNEAKFEPSSNVDGKDNNGQLNKNIKRAVHCVSLDDERFRLSPKQLKLVGTFAPTLMGQSENLTEVWFPGQHGNIGGGFYRKQLSDVTLEYMRYCLQNLGEGKNLNLMSPEDINVTALQNGLLGWGDKFKFNEDAIRNAL